jgi:hypothetical protein
MPVTRRLIALGASNLTRGFATVVDTSRTVWGEPIEVFAALGHGRSYGIRSSVAMRSLPGILESRLWEELSSRPALPSRAIVTDVGNDILYGVPVPTILGWVEECVARLRKLGSEVVLTDMPLCSIRTLGRARFTFFRSILVPRCRLSLAEVSDRAVALNDGLIRLARDGGHALARLRPEWYGIDPIHIRSRHWTSAWREILGVERQTCAASGGEEDRLHPLRLYLARPERRWLFGVEQRCSQPAIRTARGTTLWLY